MAGTRGAPKVVPYPPLQARFGSIANGGIAVSPAGVVLDVNRFQIFGPDLAEIKTLMGGMPAAGIPVTVTPLLSPGISQLVFLNIFDDAAATVLVPPNPILAFGAIGTPIFPLDGDVRTASTFPGLTANWMFAFQVYIGTGGLTFCVEVSRSQIAFPPP